MKKIFALLIMIMILTTACQPTPEELIVQNKADGELMNRIEATAAVMQPASEAPPDPVGEEAEGFLFDGVGYKTIYHESFEQTLVNGMHIVADTDVIMPDAETFPIIKYRRKQFSQMDLDNVLNVLIGDKPLYEPEIPMTKSQIESEILRLRQRLNESDRTDEQKDSLNITIEEWLKRYDTAPDTPGLVEKSRQLNEYRQIFGKVEFKENTYAMLNILPENMSRERFDDSNIGVRYSITGKDNMNELSYRLQNIRLMKLGELTETPGSFEGISIESVEKAKGIITMTPEEAIKIAEDTFHNMGAGEDVRVSDIFYLYIPAGDICPAEDVHCYAVELKRYIGNTPIKIGSSSSQGMEQRSNDGSDTFNSNMPYECMSVFISDDGIIDLEWREPMEPVEVMNQNVELVPYEKIVEVFHQEFTNSYSTYNWRTEDETIVNEANGSSHTYYAYSACELYSIELNYGMARIPNENDCYMAIPLWDFYGRYSAGSVGRHPGREDFVMDSPVDFSLITINGIDNSRFCRRWGY